MSTVVAVRRQGLATGTEISVMAHRALVAVAQDEALARSSLAERSITSNAKVDGSRRHWAAHRFIDRCEAVARVDDVGAFHACRAIVPIGASEAFVAHTDDRLY